MELVSDLLLASSLSKAGKFMTPLSDPRFAELVSTLGGLDAGTGGGEKEGSCVCEFMLGEGGRFGSILVRFVKRLEDFSIVLFRVISCSDLDLLLDCVCRVTGLNMNLSFEDRRGLLTVV